MEIFSKKYLYFAITLILTIGIYIIYRAATLSLVHDESLTYNTVKLNEASPWINDANNHWLNTSLITFCAKIMGEKEWVLRLPNILSYFCYTFFGVLILNRLKNSILKYTSFLSLVLNPFLLDFFSLARGYGLAIGFMVASIFFLLKLSDDSRQKNALIGFGLFSILSVLSNATLLIFYLSAMFIWALLQFRTQGIRFFYNPIVIATSVVHLYVLKKVLDFVFFLKSINGLYAGGNTGFISDVIGSNLTTLFYEEKSFFLKWVAPISLFIVLLFGILAIYQIFNWINNQKMKQSEILFLLLAMSVLIPIVQFHVLKVLFPTERGAVFYYPLFIFALFGTLDLLEKKWIHYWLTLPLSSFILYNFSVTANVTHCYTWGYERHTKEFLTYVKILQAAKQLPDKVTLGVHWKYQPAIEHYYRHQWHLDGVLPVIRGAIGEKTADIYYIEAGELPLVTKLDTSIVVFRQFADNKSLILTRNF
ncbi:MAG: hypothetical protein RIS64_2520 [Bacteroidota bacterium]|jgi:hypothetical protein